MSEQIEVKTKSKVSGERQAAEAEDKSLIEELQEIQSHAITIADVEKAMRECEQRLFFIRQLSRDTDNYKDFPLSVINDARRAIIVVENSTLQYEISANDIAAKKDEIEKAKIKFWESKREVDASFLVVD